MKRGVEANINTMAVSERDCTQPPNIPGAPEYETQVMFC